MLMSDGAIPFVSRSVLASALAPPEGYGPRTPLAPERQVGLQAGSRRLGGTLGIKYALGVFNGNGLNRLFNDNNSVEPVGRVELDYDKKVTLGLNASYNVLSQGPRTARLQTTQLSYGADVTAQVWRLHVLAGFLGKSSTFSFPGLSGETALGAIGQVRYVSDTTGLEAALRGAWYEPSSALPDDQVIELAAMVGWRPFEMPFRILLQYTHRTEEARVSIPNDSVDAMIHARW
jgi:hypothetical protein